MPHSPTPRSFSFRLVGWGVLAAMFGGLAAAPYLGGYAAAGVAVLALRAGARGWGVGFAAAAVLHGAAWQVGTAAGSWSRGAGLEDAALAQATAALLFPPAVAGVALLIGMSRGADLPVAGPAPAPLAGRGGGARPAPPG